jgi:hypothetical protein
MLVSLWLSLIWLEFLTAVPAICAPVPPLAAAAPMLALFLAGRVLAGTCSEYRLFMLAQI